MTKTEIRYFQERLERLISRLGGEESELRSEFFGTERNPTGGTASEQHTNDDLSRESSQGEIALTLLGNERELLDECRAAMQRIEAGTFGACKACSKPIAKHRLMALPYARICGTCARAAGD
jgi:DnaK suppressor protein